MVTPERAERANRGGKNPANLGTDPNRNVRLSAEKG